MSSQPDINPHFGQSPEPQRSTQNQAGEPRVVERPRVRFIKDLKISIQENNPVKETHRFLRTCCSGRHLENAHNNHSKALDMNKEAQMEGMKHLNLRGKNKSQGPQHFQRIRNHQILQGTYFEKVHKEYESRKTMPSNINKKNVELVNEKKEQNTKQEEKNPYFRKNRSSTIYHSHDDEKSFETPKKLNKKDHVTQEQKIQQNIPSKKNQVVIKNQIFLGSVKLLAEKIIKNKKFPQQNNHSLSSETKILINQTKKLTDQMRLQNLEDQDLKCRQQSGSKQSSNKQKLQRKNFKTIDSPQKVKKQAQAQIESNEQSVVAENLKFMTPGKEQRIGHPFDKQLKTVDENNRIMSNKSGNYGQSKAKNLPNNEGNQFENENQRQIKVNQNISCMLQNKQIRSSEKQHNNSSKKESIVHINQSPKKNLNYETPVKEQKISNVPLHSVKKSNKQTEDRKKQIKAIDEMGKINLKKSGNYDQQKDRNLPKNEGNQFENENQELIYETEKITEHIKVQRQIKVNQNIPSIRQSLQKENSIIKLDNQRSPEIKLKNIDSDVNNSMQKQNYQNENKKNQQKTLNGNGDKTFNKTTKQQQKKDKNQQNKRVSAKQPKIKDHKQQKEKKIQRQKQQEQKQREKGRGKQQQDQKKIKSRRNKGINQQKQQQNKKFQQQEKSTKEILNEIKMRQQQQKRKIKEQQQKRKIKEQKEKIRKQQLQNKYTLQSKIKQQQREKNLKLKAFNQKISKQEQKKLNKIKSSKNLSNQSRSNKRYSSTIQIKSSNIPNQNRLRKEKSETNIKTKRPNILIQTEQTLQSKKQNLKSSDTLSFKAIQLQQSQQPQKTSLLQDHNDEQKVQQNSQHYQQTLQEQVSEQNQQINQQKQDQYQINEQNQEVKEDIKEQKQSQQQINEQNQKSEQNEQNSSQQFQNSQQKQQKQGENHSQGQENQQSERNQNEKLDIISTQNLINEEISIKPIQNIVQRSQRKKLTKIQNQSQNVPIQQKQNEKVIITNVQQQIKQNKQRIKFHIIQIIDRKTKEVYERVFENEQDAKYSIKLLQRLLTRFERYGY